MTEHVGGNGESRTYEPSSGVQPGRQPAPDLSGRWKPCHHRNGQTEGVEWSADVALAHFDECFEPAERVEWFEKLRRGLDDAVRCRMADHAGRIAGLLAAAVRDETNEAEPGRIRAGESSDH